MSGAIILAVVLTAHVGDAPLHHPPVSLHPPFTIGTPLGGGAVVGDTALAAEVVPVAAGFIAPEEGCYLTTPSCVAVARRVKTLELENAALRQDYKVWQVALVGFLGLVVGGGVGYLVAARLR